MTQNNLTRKENEVYFLVTMGFLSPVVIADLMCVATTTVRQHLHKIYDTLELESNSIAGILYHYIQNPEFCNIHSVSYNGRTISKNDNYQV